MRICLIGNYNVDQLVGPLNELPPWGKEYVAPTMTVRTGGAVGNTALALCALGVSPICIGNVGEDANGAMIREDLTAAGADIAGIVTTVGAKTGVGITLVRTDGERAFVTYLGHLSDFDEALWSRSEERIAEADMILFAGYFLLPGLNREALRSALECWQGRGQIVALDTGWDPKNWTPDTRQDIATLLRYVDVFLPNREEAEAITGCTQPEKMSLQLQRMGPSLVVVKLGSQGAMARRGNEIARVNGYLVSVIDTCGAGDVFNAGVLFGLGAGWSLEQTLRFANAQAAIAVSRSGNRFPSRDEVRAFMDATQ